MSVKVLILVCAFGLLAVIAVWFLVVETTKTGL